MQAMSWYASGFCWSFGQFISYLLFLNRIKKAFQYSSHEPSKCTMVCQYALLTIFEILWIIASISPFGLIIDFEDHFNFTYTRKTMWTINFYLTIPITCLDVIISLSMTYIFVSRLYKIILSQTTMKYASYKFSEFKSLELRESLTKNINTLE